MPPFGPKQLSADELYSLTAYVLYLNGVVEWEQMLDSETLPQTKMPALDYTSSKWDREEKPR